jgi:hypothetical protein
LFQDLLFIAFFVLIAASNSDLEAFALLTSIHNQELRLSQILLIYALHVSGIREYP